MRCLYCHNPDTWDPAGAEMRDAKSLLDDAERYRAYWGKKGGITVTGGEPLLQPEFLIELFSEAKARNIHTALDTSGQPFTRKEPLFHRFEALMALTDLVLLDIKHIDPEKHRALTGRDNVNILDFARYLSDIGKPVWIRHVLVPGVTDDDGDLKRLRAFLDTLTNIQRVEVLPYHSMGEPKWDRLGIPYTLRGTVPPTQERIDNAKRLLRAQ